MEPESDNEMTHFFDKRDPWGRSPAVWIVVAMLLIAPAAWWLVSQIQLENDVRSWLPTDDPQARTLQWAHDEFPTRDSLFISWDGSSLDDPRLGRLTERLQGVIDENGVRHGGLPEVERVIGPQELLDEMARRDISRAEGLRRLTGMLVGRGPLKIRLSDAAREVPQEAQSQILGALRERLDVDAALIARPESAVDAPDDENASSESTAADGPPHYDFQVGWPRMQLEPVILKRARELANSLKDADGRRLVEDCFFLPGEPVALSVMLSDAALDDNNATVESIRQAAIASGIPADKLRMGGRAIAGEALNRSVRSAAWNAEYPFFQLLRRSLFLLSALVGAGLVPADIDPALRLLTHMLIMFRLVSPGSSEPPEATRPQVARACGPKDWDSLLAAQDEARQRGSA
ncbi:MAG: hypothetical protein KY476_22590, partial [Planctomycetes bacterium]|nr:hypothetical protein [Planctomycetota bacterium]